MAQQFFKEQIPHKGLTYKEYFHKAEEYIDNTAPEELEGTKKTLYDYSKLNLRRSIRVQKTFNPEGKIVDLVKSIKTPQLWMVLTEDWCGDSAQNLPYIAKLAELNENINLRILLRDSNLDIMDLYLTNGTARAIPKLVAFDYQGNELFQWGPRPKEAQDMINNWKAEGLQKDEFNALLHKWYATNKGAALLEEIANLLK